MNVISQTHRVSNAIRLYSVEGDNVWMIVGGQTSWPDEQNPPNPVTTTTAVDSPIGAKKGTVQLVIQDPNGTIVTTQDDPSGGSQILTRWSIVPDVQTAKDVGCRWVMFNAQIIGSELPLIPFRQIGFSLGLQQNAGAGVSAVVAEQITDFGMLQNLEYKQVVNRDSSNIYNSLAIIEF
jgi:hypothetical protein